ncbi:MAG: hypothetical protein LBH86_04885, partial [Oscillospiraceae bacterium]|nr:hypothetical protein [Oscillospiraceae bacterium]
MRIDTFTPPASRTPAEAAARESGRPAVVGDVLEAEVLTVAERQFTFRLPDGTVLSARSETVLQASPGDTLWLTVSGQSDGVLLVEAAGGRSDARSLLHQWKAGQTPQNVRLVSAMLNAGLPPAERLFRWLASALVSVPDITPEQAVFLRAHNIPLDKQSVAFLNRMSRQDLMLGRQLLGLIELLCPAAEPAGRADTAGIVSMPGRAAAAGPEATGADSAGASYGAPVSPEGSAPSGRAPGDAINPTAISPHTAASLETEILSIFGRAAADSAGGIGLPGVMDVDVLRAMIREMSDSRLPADLIEQPADLTDPARPAAADESAPAPGARAGTPEAAATPMPGEAPAAGRIPAALAR